MRKYPLLKICKFCEKEFSTFDYKKKFCNCSCAAKYNNNRRQVTEETKDKIRKARLGTKATERTKRKVSEAGKGRKHSKETRRRISESNKGKVISIEARKKMSITRLLRMTQKEKSYCDEWRDKEFKYWVKYERDGGVCQECGSKPTNSKLVHLHHIDGEKKHCHPYNLVTLCMSCHMSYHCILDKDKLTLEWKDTAKRNTKDYYNELQACVT